MSVKKTLISILVLDVLALTAAVLLGIQVGNPVKHFKEQHFITWLSVVQLIATSWFCYQTAQVRYAHFREEEFHWTKPYVIWGLMAAGFFFLGLDDLLKIHESIDHRIHDVMEWFGKSEDSLTDKIDDIIVGLYGVIGLFVMSKYWSEMKKYKAIAPLMISGFVCLVIMVILDVLTNDYNTVKSMVGKESAKTIFVSLCVAEDSFKIFGSGFFLVTFFQAQQVAQNLSNE